MTRPVKICLFIFLITLTILGGFTVYKIISATVDTTDRAKEGDTFLFGNQNVPDAGTIVLTKTLNKYNQNAQYAKALLSYQKAVDKDPKNASLYQKIAFIYEAKNRYRDALDILTKGITAVPTSADINYQIGEDSSNLIATDKTYLQKAIDAYTKAASSDKYKIFATYKEARLYSYKTDNDSLNKAKELFSSLGDFQPAKYNLVLYEIDDPDKALSSVDAASKVSPTENQDILNSDFATWADFGKTLTEQINLLKQDVTNKKSVATIFNTKGYIAYKVNRCEFALTFLKNAIIESEKDVFYPQARLVLGECLKRLGLYEEAKSYVEEVYNKNKDSVEARMILRQVYRGLGDTAGMKKMYDELITINAQNIQIRLDYANDLEVIASSKKDSALGDLETAAAQYEWLGMNLTDQSTIGGVVNKDYALNQKYLLKAVRIYTYKMNNYAKARDVINTALKITDKTFLDKNIGDELLSWIAYMQTPSDKTLENDVYEKAKNMNGIDAQYHVAYILNVRGDKNTAKEKALTAFDLDEDGYIGALAGDLISAIEK
ncbi:MAG: tetratricopeptide repeat protein [bacterium]